MEEIIKQIFEFANLCKGSRYVKLDNEMRSHEKHIYINDMIVFCEFVILLSDPTTFKDMLRITFEDMVQKNKVCVNVWLDEIDNEENLKQLVIERFNAKINEFKTWIV